MTRPDTSSGSAKESETFDAFRVRLRSRYEDLSPHLQRLARLALEDPNAFALDTVTGIAGRAEDDQKGDGARRNVPGRAARPPAEAAQQQGVDQKAAQRQRGHDIRQEEQQRRDQEPGLEVAFL